MANDGGRRDLAILLVRLLNFSRGAAEFSSVAAGPSQKPRYLALWAILKPSQPTPALRTVGVALDQGFRRRGWRTDFGMFRVSPGTMPKSLYPRASA